MSTARTLGPHVLLVGKDASLCRRITRYFSRFGLRVSCVKNSAAMNSTLGEKIVDLILIDLALPGEDGIGLARELRAHSAMPIIMLGSRPDDVDRIMSLELGADDYVAKPFNPRELVARVRAVLRRAHRHPVGEAAESARAFRFSGWELDLRLHRLVAANGKRVELTSAELALLRVFVGAPQRVLTREELAELSREHGDEITDRTIDVLILRLRRKLEVDPHHPVLIITSRGIGYSLDAQVSELS
jgi:two-component system, OmpR family, response regulator